ncbi:MAG: hypothetical protein HKN13_13635 [Rhodothermales bacterium]|nr:hypothetical protein [Rhodothermales bacterium]
MDEANKWVVVFESGTDYESEIVRDRLDDAGIPAVIDTKRDHAFFLNVGSLSNVFVRVPIAYEADARSLLASAPISAADLEEAAMNADPVVDVDPEIDVEDDDRSDLNDV